jgi:hypothetical protein
LDVGSGSGYVTVALGAMLQEVNGVIFFIIAIWK